MYNNQQAIMMRAMQHIRRLPMGVNWMFTLTDQDGEGEDPMLSVLNITAPEDDMLSVMDALGGKWEDVESDFGRSIRVRMDETLEITVEAA